VRRVRRIRVGVVGVGLQGENHLKVYSVNPAVEIAAVADVNEARLQEVSAKYPVKAAYTSYLEMLKREDLDLVSVATPDFAHKEPSVEAMERGVNVVVEKPMATSVEDAEEMVRASKREGVILYVNFSNRWNPLFAITKERLDRGELGSPRYAYLRLSDTIYVPTKMISWASKTNVVYFLMSHTADLARWLFSDEVSRVRAWAGEGLLKSMGVDTFDYVVAVLEFRGGGRAVLESAWILPEGMPCVVDFKFELLCTKGAVNVDARFHGIEVARDRLEYPRYLVFSTIRGRPYGACKESLDHVVSCVVEGREPDVKPDDGLANTKVLCAIVESIKRGAEVELS